MAFCLDKNVEAELRAISGNNTCVDCDGRGPQWASVSFGIFMCLECSGRHRALGVHISFVRSVSMDSWTEKQINLMRNGGNNKFNEFLKAYDIKKETPIANKYNLPAATLYKDRLLAQVEGRPLPTELPKLTSSSSSSSMGSATPGGTDPLPGESEEEYVARQKKLQAEAKERLRAKFGGANGLSSNGVMAGIGSDPGYKPGGGGTGSAPDMGAQIAGVFSLVSSSVVTLSESVTRSITTSADNANGGSGGTGAAPLIAPETIDAYKQTVVTGWSNLATGAVGLWSKTLEVAREITKPPDEDDYKFPRGTFTGEPDASSQSQQQPPPAFRQQVSQMDDGSRTSQNNFYAQDSEADHRDNAMTKPPTHEPVSKGVLSMSSSNHSINKSSLNNSNNGSLNNLNSSNSTNKITSGTKKQNTPSTVAAAPAGDDFFKTFGV